MLDALDEAIEARVVSEVPGATGRLRFAPRPDPGRRSTHELTRSRRAQLIGAVGEALEAVYAADLEAHLAELAHHFLESAGSAER